MKGTEGVEKSPANENEATLFGLLRHGTTLWNEEKRIQGRCDSPLSASGVKLISGWAEHLRKYTWNRILASDLGRAKQTVSILNESLHLPVLFTPALREIDWGKWEGMRLEEVKRTSNEELARQTAAGWDFRAPEGESRREALTRARTILLQSAAKWPGERILVVCHQGIIKCLLYDILDREFLPHEKRIIRKSAFHRIHCCNATFSVDTLNIHPQEKS